MLLKDLVALVTLEFFSSFDLFLSRHTIVTNQTVNIDLSNLLRFLLDNRLHVHVTYHYGHFYYLIRIVIMECLI